jgi:CRP/FNR family transcriptional regulator
LRIVISGIVKVFDYTRNGEQFIHKFVYPGEFLKLQPWAEIPKCTTIALTDVKICDIAYQWHRQAEAPFPGIDRVLLASAIWENNHAELWQRILVLRKPLDRVIYFLLDIAERSGIYCDRECLIELPMTRSDVADYLGLKRETVSRAFSQLRDEGYISVLNRQTHAIRNIRRLANLVDSEIVTSSVNSQQSGRIDAPRQYDA